MYQLIEIQTIYEKALSVLVSQKQSLDRYREKANHNKEWARRREEGLVTLSNYLIESKRVINALAKELEGAYVAGKIAGREEVEREGQNDFRGHYKLTDVLNEIMVPHNVLKAYTNKETIRIATKEIAKQTWPELF